MALRENFHFPLAAGKAAAPEFFRLGRKRQMFVENSFFFQFTDGFAVQVPVCRTSHTGFPRDAQVHRRPMVNCMLPPPLDEDDPARSPLNPK